MKYIQSLLTSLLRRDEGQGLVEYAMILGLVAMIAVLTLQSIGFGIDGLYDKLEAGLNHVPNQMGF